MVTTCLLQTLLDSLQLRAFDIALRRICLSADKLACPLQ